MKHKKVSPNITEKALQDARQGDFDGFARFFLAESAKIKYHIFGIVGCNEIARDIVSNTYIKACDNIGRYSHDHHMATWLCRIAKNLALDYINSKAYKNTDPIGDRIFGESFQAPLYQEDDLELQSARSLINKLIEGLHETHAQMLKLRFFENMKYEEIADSMGVPIGTVKGQISRSLQKLSKNATLRKMYA